MTSKSLWASFRRLTQGFVGYGTGAVARRVLALLFIPVFTRSLSTEQYGIVATAAVAVAVLSPVFGLGLRGAVTRQYFEFRSDSTARTRYVYSVLIGTAISGALLALLFLLILAPDIGSSWLGIPVYPHGFVIVLTGLCIAYLETILGVHRAREEVRRYVFADLGHYLLAGLLAVAAVVLFRWEALGKLVGDLVGVAIALLVLVFLVRPVRRPPGGFSRTAFTRALRFGLPLVPHLLAMWALAGIDRFFVAGQISIEAAGIYDIGYRAGAVVAFAVAAVNLAWGPIVFDLAPEGDDSEGILGAHYTFILAGLSLVTLAVSLFGNTIVAVLGGAAYGEAVDVVTPIALGYMFYGVYGLASHAIFYGNATRLLPLLTISAGGLNILLNLGLIPVFGFRGAAYATLISYCLLGLVAQWLGRRFIAYRLDRVVLGGAAVSLIALLGGYEVLLKDALHARSSALEVALETGLVVLHAAVITVALTVTHGTTIRELIRSAIRLWSESETMDRDGG